MHAELTSTRTETTRRYSLTDAPTLTVAGLLVDPETATVVLVDGRWSLLKFYGRVVRADGSRTGRPATTTYYAPHETPPEWASQLIDPQD